MNRFIAILFVLMLMSCHPKRSEDNVQKESAKESDSTDQELVELLDVKSQENNKDLKEVENSKVQFRLDLDKINTFKCSSEIILHVSSNIDSLSSKDIDALLRTFDKSCSVNVEFTEISNEVLFKTLERYPEETLRLLEQNHSKYDFQAIFSELTYPIHDGLPLKKIKNVVAEENLIGTRIDSVLLALELAANSN